MASKILTDEQIDTIIMQLSKGQKVFTEQDGEIVLNWAHSTIINKSLLGLLLNKRVVVAVEKGNVKFSLPGKMK